MRVAAAAIVCGASLAAAASAWGQAATLRFATPTANSIPVRVQTPIMLAPSRTTKRSTKPCYVGTHRQGSRDSKLVKALEAKGTVACEQPPRPNINSANFAAVIANLA